MGHSEKEEDNSIKKLSSMVESVMSSENKVNDIFEILTNDYSPDISLEDELELLNKLEEKYIFNKDFLSSAMENFKLSLMEDKKYVIEKGKEQLKETKEKFNKGFKETLKELKKELNNNIKSARKAIDLISKDAFKDINSEGFSVLKKVIEKLPDKLDQLEIEDFNEEQIKIIKIVESLPDSFLEVVKEFMNDNIKNMENSIDSDEIENKIKNLIIKELRSYITKIKSEDLQSLKVLKETMTDAKLKYIGDLGTSLNDDKVKEELRITKENLHTLSLMNSIKLLNSKGYKEKKEYKELSKKLIPYKGRENIESSIIMDTMFKKKNFITSYHNLTSFVNISNTISIKDVVNVFNITNPKKQVKSIKDISLKLVSKITSDLIITKNNSTLTTDTKYFYENSLKKNEGMYKEIAEIIVDINEEDKEKLIAISMYLIDSTSKMDTKSLELTRRLSSNKEGVKLTKSVFEFYKSLKKDSIKSYRKLIKKVGIVSNELDIFNRMESVISNKIEEYSTMVDKSDDLYDEIESSIEDFKQNVKDSIEEIEDAYEEKKIELENSLINLNEIKEQMLKDNEVSMNNDINETIIKINDKIEIVKGFISNQEKEFNESITKANEIYEKINKSVNEVNENIEDFSKKINEIKSEIESDLKNITSIKENISDLFPESEKILKELKKFKSENISIKEYISKIGRDAFKKSISIWEDKIVLTYNKIANKKEYKKAEKENRKILNMHKIFKLYGIELKEGNNKIDENSFLKQISDVHQFKMRIFYAQKRVMTELKVVEKKLEELNSSDSSDKNNKIQELKNKQNVLKTERERNTLLYYEEMGKKFKNRKGNVIKSEYENELNKFMKVEKKNTFLLSIYKFGKNILNKNKEEIGFYTEEEELFNIFIENNKDFKLDNDIKEIMSKDFKELSKISYETVSSMNILGIGKNKGLIDIDKNDEYLESYSNSTLSSDVAKYDIKITEFNISENVSNEVQNFDDIEDEDELNNIVEIKKRIEILYNYSNLEVNPEKMFMSYDKLLKDITMKITQIKDPKKEEEFYLILKTILFENLEILNNRRFMINSVLDEEKNETNGYTYEEKSKMRNEEFKIINSIIISSFYIREIGLYSKEEKYECPYDFLDSMSEKNNKLFINGNKSYLVNLLLSNRKYYKTIKKSLDNFKKEDGYDNYEKRKESNRIKIHINFRNQTKVEMQLNENLKYFSNRYPKKIKDKEKFLEKLVESKMELFDILLDHNISNDEMKGFLKISEELELHKKKILSNNESPKISSVTNTGKDLGEILNNHKDNIIVQKILSMNEVLSNGLDIEKSVNPDLSNKIKNNNIGKKSIDEMMMYFISSYTKSISGEIKNRNQSKYSMLYGDDYENYKIALKIFKAANEQFKLKSKNFNNESKLKFINDYKDTFKNISMDTDEKINTLLECSKDESWYNEEFGNSIGNIEHNRNILDITI